MILEFKKLTERDNFDEVAKLILCDDLDYLNLIGTYKDNKDVFLSLMKNSDSIFYYNNYYIVKDKSTEKIVAAGMFFGFQKFELSSAIIRRAFGSLGKDLPPTFKETYNAIAKMFSTIVLGGLATQIVVDKDYRGFGVGTFLLKNLLNIYGKTPSFLWVSKDNVSAVKLYSKFGYEIVDTFIDSDGKVTREECKMFREGSDIIYN